MKLFTGSEDSVKLFSKGLNKNITMTENRKRTRSSEDFVGLQTKYFVNQQLVEKSDKMLMQKVYGKRKMSFANNPESTFF